MTGTRTLPSLLWERVFTFPAFAEISAMGLAGSTAISIDCARGERKGMINPAECRRIVFIPPGG